MDMVNYMYIAMVIMIKMAKRAKLIGKDSNVYIAHIDIYPSQQYKTKPHSFYHNVQILSSLLLIVVCILLIRVLLSHYIIFLDVFLL